MSKTALLVMDVQRGIVSRLHHPDLPNYLSKLSSTIHSARAAHIKTVYVVTSFRRGYPEINPRNPAFSRLALTGGFVHGDDMSEVHPAVTPGAEDVVVTKKRVSAFAGSDLDMVLKAAAVERLVLTGLTTSGVVLSTARQAADLDYGVTVLRDLCLDRDEEVQRVLMEKVFRAHLEVVDADEWLAGLQGN